MHSRHNSLSRLSATRAPNATLFPYTTLFRSIVIAHPGLEQVTEDVERLGLPGLAGEKVEELLRGLGRLGIEMHVRHERSEEHTSELQSLTNLVCRLLLEKKKQTYNEVEPSPR